MDKILNAPAPLRRRLLLTVLLGFACLLVGLAMFLFAKDRHSKIQIGFRYRFYFKKTQRLTLGSEYFDSALSSDCFLGFEELGELDDHSEPPEKAD